MSYPDPYQSPQYVPPESKPGLRSLQYQEMYAYVFQNPNWMVNLLWGSLCILVAGIIPIVPYMVLFGYQFEIIEAMHRRRAQIYPDFDTNRIGDYLTRGLWPVLAGVVVSLVFMVVALPIFFIGIFGSAALADNVHGVVGLLTFLLTMVLYMGILIGMNIVIVPVMLRAGLTQEFSQAFDFAWIKSFVSLVWKELILGSLFIVVANFALTIVGMMALCVGVYPAMAVAILAQAHFMWQLYEIFLERGGEPVPLKNAVV